MSDKLESAVMVVEDSDDDWDTVVTAARETGIDKRLHRALDGESGLDQLLATRRHGHAPAFVLLDLNLPGIDGREVLTTVRSDALLRCLPVIVITTSANPRDVASCYAAGANAYHVKPVRYPEYTALLKTVFEYWCRHALLPAGPLVAPR